jgi:regulator of protease activity HflC (stomatin/prohibitin superfamily)
MNDVVLIFLLALFGIMLTLGAWFVRGLSRARVTTMFGEWSRAESPAAYWFWAVYHVAGLALVIVATLAVTLYFVLSVIA